MDGENDSGNETVTISFADPYIDDEKGSIGTAWIVLIMVILLLLFGSIWFMNARYSSKGLQDISGEE